MTVIVLGDRRHLVRFPQFPQMEAFQFDSLRVVGSTVAACGGFCIGVGFALLWLGN